MAQFFGKIFGWFANEVLVKTLAENKAFQRLAVKIDSTLSTKQETLKEVGKEYMKAGETLLKDGAEKINKTAAQSSGFDFGKFAKAFQEEVQKVSNLDLVTRLVYTFASHYSSVCDALVYLFNIF